MIHIRLSPVLYIPKLDKKLLSLGEWLQQGCVLRGTKHKLAIMQGSQTSLSLYPHQPGGTIYWLTAKLVHKTALLASVSTIYAVDYDLMHRRMGHSSRDVLRQATRHTENFPKEIQFPVGSSNLLICRGCAEGKMHLQPFVDSVSQASRSFELIHSDLKELPTISYHKYKYSWPFWMIFPPIAGWFYSGSKNCPNVCILWKDTCITQQLHKIKIWLYYTAIYDIIYKIYNLNHVIIFKTHGLIK